MVRESNIRESRTPSVVTGHSRRLGYTAARVATLALLACSLAAPALAQWYWRHPQPQGKTLQAVSFLDAATGMAVGDGGAILRTDDGGRTWLFQGNDIPLERRPLSVSLADESNGLAVGLELGTVAGFIMRTTDGGATWDTPWSQPLSSITDVSYVDADQGVAVAVGVDFTTFTPFILRTTDGGGTWEQQSTNPPDVEVGLNGVAFADSSTGTAVGLYEDLEGVILRTTDGGVTWELQDTGMDLALLNQVDYIDANIGVAVGTAGTMLRTTDGGETWQPQQSGTALQLYDVALSATGTGVAVGGDVLGVILNTTDGGATWAVRGVNDYLFGAALSDANTATAVGGGGAIMRSTDGGSTWVQQATKIARRGLWDVSFINPNVATAVGGFVDEGSTIVRTEDGGNTWVEQESGTALPLTGVSFVDEDTGFAVGGNPLFDQLDRVVLKTTDGGDHWMNVTSPNLPSASLREVSCTDANVCTAVGSCETIVRTENGGDSWEVQQQPTCPSLLFTGVFFTDASTGTVVGGSKILRTTDGGGTWTPQASPIGGLDDVFFVNEQVGFAVGKTEFTESPGAIIATVDGGETWTVQRDDLPSVATAVEFTDAVRGAVVTRGGQIYRTSDGGASWELEQVVPGNLSGISFGDTESAMTVGTVGVTDGAIFKTLGGPAFPVSLMPSSASVCVSDGGTEEVTVGVAVESVAGYSDTVALSTAGEPAGVTTDLNPASVDPPGGAAWTLSVDPSVPNGRHVITLIGDDGAQQQIANLLLDVVDPAPAPALVEPANGATDVDLQPTFTWSAVPEVDTYRIQVATDSGFGDIVVDSEVIGTSFAALMELDSDTQYFWRVRAILGCAGAWSEVFDFTTEVQPLAEVTPEALAVEVEAGGSDSATLDIANVGTGDLNWSIETAQPPTGAVGGSVVGSSASRRTSARRGGGRSAGTGAALDLISVSGEPLPSVRPISPVGGVVDCDTEPGLIVHDDGTVERGYGGNPDVVNQLILVDRFTPSAYPATFDAVCVAWITDGPTSLDFEIVVFDDDGQEGSPGTELGALPVSADGIPGDPGEPVWFSYDISSLGLAIDSGSVYIGMRWTPSSPNVFLAADESPGNPPGFAGGYFWTDNSGTWAPIESGIPSYRSLFVRVVANLGGCQDPTAVPWLGVAPDSGSTPAGGSTPVEVTVDGTGLDAGQYRASLCVATNDASQPLIVVPVTLTVTEGGVALTFDPSSLDFGDVDVGTTSSSQTAMLQNLGSGDATGLGFTSPVNGFEADTSACGGSLPGGESCEVSVVFSPAEPGPAKALLGVTSDQGPSTALFLAGNGVQNPPRIEFEPTSLDFGDVEMDDTSAPLTAMLHNIGVDAATELTFDLGDSAFTADTGDCGTSLPAGQSCTVSVTFAPAEPGLAAATLHAASAEGATADLGLAGNGVAPGVVTPMALEVDPVERVSDGNSVFEPGELIDVAPTWRNDGSAPVSLTGTAADFHGPDGADYMLSDADADYGLVDPGAEASCQDLGVCYRLGVNDPAARPATHWEATFDETLSDETAKTWALHIGDSFTDVPRESAFYASIETLLHNGVTEGCTATEYCPAGTNTRAQMAVFLLKAAEAGDYVPPACDAGDERFDDVPADSTFCPWIEELAARAVTSGCGGDNYCPGDSVTRAQMAVFLLKAAEGEGYTPPKCNSAFTDVPCPSTFANWIEELANRGITSGCSATMYCPGDTVTRQQMAVFLGKAFGLTLYGP